MRSSLLPVFLLAGLSVAGPCLAQSGTSAAPPDRVSGQKAEDVTVGQAWARASAGRAQTAAAYLTLTGGEHDDALTGVSTPAATTAAVHESMTEGGVMRMRPVPSLPVKAGRSVTLAPGGYHIMMMGLKQPLAAGQTFPLTLTFAHARPVTVQVEVRPIGTQMAPHMQTGQDMRGTGSAPDHAH